MSVARTYTTTEIIEEINKRFPHNKISASWVLQKVNGRRTTTITKYGNYAYEYPPFLSVEHFTKGRKLQFTTKALSLLVTERRREISQRTNR